MRRIDDYFGRGSNDSSNRKGNNRQGVANAEKPRKAKKNQKQIQNSQQNRGGYLSKLPVGMTEVLPNILYIGSGKDARDKKQLKARSIGLVLNFCTEFNSSQTAKELGIAHKNLGMLDQEQEEIVHFFEETVKIIDDARSKGIPVLAHCVVGKSRSASFVLAYLMKRERMTLHDAMTFLRARRDISPNDGFMKQLIHYEHSLFGAVSVSSWQTSWGGQTRIVKYEMPKDTAQPTNLRNTSNTSDKTNKANTKGIPVPVPAPATFIDMENDEEEEKEDAKFRSQKLAQKEAKAILSANSTKSRGFTILPLEGDEEEDDEDEVVDENEEYLADEADKNESE